MDGKMDTQLSILANFDDLRRWESVLTDGAAENEFLRFAQSQDENRLSWLTALQEAQRLQRELDASLQNVAGLETKLFHARKLLEQSERARKEADAGRLDLLRKISQAHNLLYTENINEATRTKFAFLQNQTGAGEEGGAAHGTSRRSIGAHASPYNRRQSLRPTDCYGNQLNSTGSILSDLSVTQSEDDFLDDVQFAVPSRMRKHHEGAAAGEDPNASFVGAKRSRASIDGKQAPSRRQSMNPNQQQQQQQQQQHQHIEYLGGGADKIVASTRVSIPHGNGPITAESVIEAIPEKRAASCEPSPPRTVIKKRQPPPPPQVPSQQQLPKTPAKASAPSLSAFESSPGTPLRSSCPKTPAAAEQPRRPHSFAVRTFLKSDTCQHCQRRIKFGCSGLKCRDCRICIHTDCRPLVQLACAPASAAGAGPVTPKGAATGCVADYAPQVAPRVPALLVHCINEIESRGLTEVGLYRVNGSEANVRALKERFMRGKGGQVPPQLGKCDVHVLCGCVKDFLRNLREPLVPHALWKDFAAAVEPKTEGVAAVVVGEEEPGWMDRLLTAIGHMPEANRDTMAFMMQHFLRIARAEMVQMPVYNIARCLGPTIVGYSSAEPDPHKMINETFTLVNIMEKLLQIPADYWCRYLTVPGTGGSTAASSVTTSGRYAPMEVESSDGGASAVGAQYFGTPSFRKTGRKNKFYATPPYSTIIKK